MTGNDSNTIDPFGVEAVRCELIRLSVFIDEHNIQASFEPNDCPFVDETCECIKHGGEASSVGLASMLHHIAENLES